MDVVTLAAATAAAKKISRLTRLRVIGHSYADPILGSNFAVDQRFTAKVCALLGTKEENYSVAGAGMYLDGTATLQYLRSGVVPGEVAPWLPACQAALIFMGINDVAVPSLLSAGFAGTADTLRMLIERNRAGGVMETNGASWAFATGTGGVAWTQGSVSLAAGSNGATAGANGNTWTLTLPSTFPGGAVSIFGVRSTTSGAVHTITVDGSAVAAWDTRSNPNGVTVPSRYRTAVLAAGAHTIVGTITNLAAGGEILDFACFDGTTIPLVVVANTPRITAQGITASPSRSDANVATINAVIAGVLAEYDSKVVLWDADAAMAKTTTYFTTQDGTHPNALGHAKLAESLLTVLLSRLPAIPSLAETVAPGPELHEVLKVRETPGLSTGSRQGLASLVAGTITVATRAVDANSRIHLTAQNAGTGGRGELYISARTNNTSFVITSTDATDNRQVAWTIVEGAAT